jgi:GNAT superfamily N-acetyltransferase
VFFIFGTTNRERERGFVVDRCAQCQSLRWFKVVDRYTVWHVYFVPIGRGELESTTVRCTQCDGRVGFDERRYTEILPTRSEEPLEAALARTTPELARRLERLARLEQLGVEPAYRGTGDAGQDLLARAVERLRRLELGGVDASTWLARLERWPRLSPGERELLAAELGGYAQALGVS